ncbi:MAG: WYL domain-containing transcriptional regulator [Ruminococcaceae bacterium]|nr:WYL domain-containing transcriptional regulator [Oscillospiraceae bacterium]
MSGFSELIKNFEKTRDYVRDFFIYGFKVRGDFNRKSARTYDDEKRRVESWLGEFLRYDDSVRGRQISISVDSGHIPENPLYKAFYSKSFTDNDIRLHFLIQDVLCGGSSLSLRELVDEIDSRYGIFFDDQTVRNKLKEYVAEGLIVSEKRGKTAYFSLSPDRADEYFGGFGGLADAVKFFSEAGEFGIVGNSILKSVGMENDLFFMKHNYIVHTLEDAILFEILEAIEHKRTLLLYTFSAKSRSKKESENLVVPMRISASVQTGRRYLVAYIPLYNRFNAFRLDYIRAVKTVAPFAEFDGIYEKYRKNENRCFGVSFGERRETGNVTPLEVTIRIDRGEEYIINRIEREKRNGTLKKLSDDLYKLTIDAFDPVEPMHWVKTFIGRIVKLEGGNAAARELFENDIRRMNAMYNGNGGEQNDDIQ